MNAYPEPSAISPVRRILERAPLEHPRVVEWAVHATAALDSEASGIFIDVFQEMLDFDVREACLVELVKAPGLDGPEFLTNFLEGTPDPLFVLTILRNIGPRLYNLPPRFTAALDRAVASIQDTNGLLASASGVFTNTALTASQRRQIRVVLDDPMMRTAARLLLDPSHMEAAAVFRTELVVGVLIALDEEFAYFTDALGGGFIVDFDADGGAYHLKQLEWPNSMPTSLVTRVVGHKGGEHASIAATQLIMHFRPDFLITIGISGALTSDLTVGDIIIGDTVTSYLANSRIVDSERGRRFDFRMAGEPYRADKWLSDRAAGLRYEAGSLYAAWHANVVQLRHEMLSSTAPSTVTVLRGDIAAGPSVVASHAFKDWLLSHKRDYLAVDMESSGVAAAAWSDAIRRVRLLMLRGVSDLADPNKTALEQSTRGHLRKLAMVTASRYLLASLHHIAANKVIQ